MSDAEPIREDRGLTAPEAALIRWLLEHGTPDAVGFLPQLDRARVVSRCPCGCASIDFAIGGVVAPEDAGMDILADYLWEASDGTTCGVFVFSGSGLLAGLEVWSADGPTAPTTLPSIGQLRPLTTS